MKQMKEPASTMYRKIKQGNDFKKNRLLYLMLMPGLVILALFKIGPMVAMVISFQDFSPALGIKGSPWVHFDNFVRIFKDPYILVLVKNTILLAFFSVAVAFPFPILFSLFLNEVRQKHTHDGIQALCFLPYFISSAVIVSITYSILSPSTGIVNSLIVACGGQSINFMAKPEWFRPLYVILDIWQTFGYSSIIYLAAITSINPELYEAAEVDGAGRWTKMFKVTLPCISTTIIVMLIIRVGSIFSVNMERILLMYNASVYSTADVIQTYVYRIAFQSTGFPEYSYGTTVNMVKSVIAFLLVKGVNNLADKYAETRMF